MSLDDKLDGLLETLKEDTDNTMRAIYVISQKVKKIERDVSQISKVVSILSKKYLDMEGRVNDMNDLKQILKG